MNFNKNKKENLFFIMLIIVEILKNNIKIIFNFGISPLNKNSLIQIIYIK